MTSIVCDLLDGFLSLENEAFQNCSWLRPTLSSLVEANTKSVQLAVTKVVNRMVGNSKEQKDSVKNTAVVSENGQVAEKGLKETDEQAWNNVEAEKGANKDEVDQPVQGF